MLSCADRVYAARVGRLELNQAWAREALGRRFAMNEYLYAIGVIALVALFMFILVGGITCMTRSAVKSRKGYRP